MAQYITKQKKILLELLIKNREKAYTIDELIEKMGDLHGGKMPGKSTVYRLMTRLVDDGKVKRFVKGNSRQFLYQIVDGESCEHHLHLKCVTCGKLLHLDEGLSHELLSKVNSSADFFVSEQSTVLFGKCGECKKI